MLVPVRIWEPETEAEGAWGTHAFLAAGSSEQFQCSPGAGPEASVCTGVRPYGCRPPFLPVPSSSGLEKNAPTLTVLAAVQLLPVPLAGVAVPAGAGSTIPLSAAADTLVGLAMGRTVIQTPLSIFCIENH